tara:strand:+ start:270 stop:1859 length:1590 start_codon:yes stop_codon:yes gene_type:complete
MSTLYDKAINYDSSIRYDDIRVGFGKYNVFVDWNNDGDFADTNDDISADVTHVRTRIGRNFASQLTGEAVAGSMTVTVRNETGKYSPFNTSGALYGNLVPNRKIQFSSYYPTVNALFTGFIESVVPETRMNKSQFAIIEAKGAFRRFAQQNIRVPMSTSTATGTAIGAVLDASDWPSSDRSIDTGETTMSRFFFTGKALTGLRQIEHTESGFIKETKDGKIAFEDRHHRLETTNSNTSQATFADDGTGLSYMNIQQEDAMSLVYNEFLSPVSVYSVASVATLWTHPLATTTGSAPALEDGESITILAEYPNETSNNNVVGVETWTTPVATTDYLANTASNGTGTNKTSDLSISVSKTSKNMEITITNGAGEKVYLTKLQARGTSVSISDPAIIKTSDATSQTKYGKRTYPRNDEAKFVPTQEEAHDWCLQSLNAHKEPTATLQISFSANESNANLTEALTRDISDRITVKANNNVKFGISRDFFVEAIIHRIDIGGSHNVTYLLSDTGGFTGFWILGKSALGIDTRLTY